MRRKKIDLRSWSEIAATFFVVFVVSFVGTADAPITNGDEARFAQAAREMAHRGDWVVPTFGGQDRYDKPILIYWMTIAASEVLGDTPRAARIPSNLAAALSAALLAAWARRRWGGGAGLIAGLVLAASPVFFVQARACTADSLNMLWIMIAMQTLEPLLFGNPTLKTKMVFWIAIALGLLTKGPVILVFVAATPLALWAISRTWARWQVVVGIGCAAAGLLGAGAAILAVPAAAALIELIRSPHARSRLASFGWLWGLPLTLAITLPWATLAWQATGGDFFRVAVGRHVVERSATALEGHGGFPGFYLVTLLVLGFPWAVSALSTFRTAWGRRFGEAHTRYMLAWAIGPLVVLELLGTKLVHYWMPSYPAMILLVMAYLWGFLPGQRSWVWAALHSFGGLALAAAPLIVVVHFQLDELFLTALVCSLVLVVPVVWSFVRWRKDPAGAMLVSTGAALLFLLSLFAVFVPKLSGHFVGARTVERINTLRGADEALVVHRLRDEEILFHLPMKVDVTRSFAELQDRLLADRPSLVVVRRRDFDDVREAIRRGQLTIIDEVEGIDLGRGRIASTLLLRTSTNTP